MSYKPISDYGLIGNMLSAALVAKDGAIDWCCLPRFDSPSIFAAILDDTKGGKFQISPPGPFQRHQSYLPDTNVLQTTFETANSVATLTDFMPCYLDSRRRVTTFHEVHRLVDCVDGEAPLEAIFDPKPGYAGVSTLLEISKHGVSASGGRQSLSLSASVPFVLEGGQAKSRFVLRKGEKAVFVLRYGSPTPRHHATYRSNGKLQKTVAYWRAQSAGCLCCGPWREAIVRSCLALHLLVYSPTGAVIAAPTTSLPEEVGGERNWDYRYAWLRDASLIINALTHVGHGEEARGFMKWLIAVCEKCAPPQILYGIDLNEPIEEQILDHLEGYRSSRPVRIGNAAYRQRQLDVFGEILEVAFNYLRMSGYISRHVWALLEKLVNSACELWQLPDSGIWEVRGGVNHFVHSKLMCWVAVDRGIKIAETLGFTNNIKYWRQTREQIRDDILTRGWNSQRRAFTQHYGTQVLDASCLLIPLFGFLPISDERVKSTIDSIMAELSWNGLVRRYRTDETEDGLSGSEGAFLWCSFWLVRDLLRLGRLEEAKALYERLLGFSNHLGLFSEMVDPRTGEALGNFPQGLNHLAVIITGLELDAALQGKSSDGGD